MTDSSAKRRRTFGLGRCDGLLAEPLKRPRGAVDRGLERIGGTGIRRFSGAARFRLYSVRMRPMVRTLNLGRREPLMAICDMSDSVGAILRMEHFQDVSVSCRSVFHLFRTRTEARRWNASGRIRADGREEPAAGGFANRRCSLRNAGNVLIRRSRTACSNRRLEAESEARDGGLGRCSSPCEFIKLGELK